MKPNHFVPKYRLRTLGSLILCAIGVVINMVCYALLIRNEPTYVIVAGYALFLVLPLLAFSPITLSVCLVRHARWTSILALAIAASTVVFPVLFLVKQAENSWPEKSVLGAWPLPIFEFVWNGVGLSFAPIGLAIEQRLGPRK
jgi:hypothetical protein